MKIICIYPGRFQPFHKSHYGVYKYLCSKFGKNNVYISTSNKTEQKSPFTFAEKQKIINSLYGIPKSHIILNGQPYKTDSLQSMFDVKDTALVFPNTQKDVRLTNGKYFKGKPPKDPKPFDEQAYVVPVPFMSNKIGGKEVSGTVVRNLFKSPELSIDDKKKVFKQLFGTFNQGIFKIIMSKLAPGVKQSITQGPKLPTAGYGNDKVSMLIANKSLLFSQTIINKLLTPSKVKVFHYCSQKSFQKLKSLQGSKKMIAATTIKSWRLLNNGVAVGGGICAYLQGDFLGHFKQDLGSRVDQRGKRWVGAYDLPKDIFVLYSPAYQKWAQQKAFPDGMTYRRALIDDDSKIRHLAVKSWFDDCYYPFLKKNEGTIIKAIEKKDQLQFAQNNDEVFISNFKILKTFNLKDYQDEPNRDKIKKEFDKWITPLRAEGKEHTDKQVIEQAPKLPSMKNVFGKMSTIRLIQRQYFPLSQTVIRKMMQPVRARAFHYTNKDGMKKVKSMQGSKRALACTTNKEHQYLNGVATGGGFCLYLQGDVMGAFDEDMLSKVDENGKRWVKANYFRKISPEYTKMHQAWLNDSFMGPGGPPNSQALCNDFGHSRQALIKDWFDKVCYPFIKKHQKTIISYIQHRKEDLASGKRYNQIILSNIKVLSVYNAAKQGWDASDFKKWVNPLKVESIGHESQTILEEGRKKLPNALTPKMKTHELIIQGQIPINNHTIKEIYNPPRVRVYHYCGEHGLQRLKSIQSTKRSISTTREAEYKYIERSIGGVGKGICVYVEGDALLHSKEDAYTDTDKKGQRWVPYWLLPQGEQYYRILKVKLEKQAMDGLTLKELLLHRDGSRQKQGVQYWVRNHLKPYLQKNQHAIIDEFKFDISRGWGSLDQIILNNIKIIDVFEPTYIRTDDTKRRADFKSWVNSHKPKVVRQNKEGHGKLITEGELIRQECLLQKKILLNCGGASGHMSHPFEDNNLTFNDFKTLINRALTGNLDYQSQATMKYDGQNINVSWKNGKMIAARNKGHLKNFGQTAPDLDGIKSIFAGRGDLYDAFVFAISDLQKAFKSVGLKKQTQIFDNGKKWIALEIIYPKTANVIPYDRSMLIFHNVTQVDENGDKVKVDPAAAKDVYAAIHKVNANIQKNFSINPPTVVKLPKVKNFSQRRGYFMNKLKALQSKYGLNGNNTLGDYNDAYFGSLIDKNLKGYKIPKEVKDGLIKRWSRMDKSYSLNQFKSDCNHDKFKQWALFFDKNDHTKAFKQNSFEWEVLFLQLGVEILKNMSNYMVVNPDKAVQAMVKQIQATAQEIRSSNDLNAIQKLDTQMKRLNAIGGLKSVLPTEGVVFTYKGNIYKATGAFADTNAIMGMIKYSR